MFQKFSCSFCHKAAFTLIVMMLSVAGAFAQFNTNGTVAHRGAWKVKNNPQNSIAALKAAYDMGCYGSEFDVLLTKDNIPVVNHDPDFMGIPVETSNYKDLLANTLPNGEKLPTLEEYIREALKYPRFQLVLDIKSSKIGKERNVLLGKYASEVVKKLGAEDRVIFIAPDFDALVKVLMINPHARVCYSNADKKPEVLKELGFLGVAMSYKRFNSGEYSVAEAKKAGLVVCSYVVNEAEDMKQQLHSGVDFIFSNEPELLIDMTKQVK